MSVDKLSSQELGKKLLDEYMNLVKADTMTGFELVMSAHAKLIEQFAESVAAEEREKLMGNQ